MAAPNESRSAIRTDFERLVRALSTAAPYPDYEGTVEVVQTHISVVFLLEHRVLKIKKPTRLWGLVDYTTLEQRKAFCELEIKLNRRLTTNLYQGVIAITGSPDAPCIGEEGRVLEYGVVMRRLPAGSSLAERLRLDPASIGLADIESIAERLADFHATHPSDPPLDARARLRTFRDVIEANFAGSREGVETGLFPEDLHEAVYRRLLSGIHANRDALDAGVPRPDRGRLPETVDGHGDLRLDHVVHHDGVWQVMDCVEFSPTLRLIDPFSDLAFLSMDLTAKGHIDLARALETAYATHARAQLPSLLPLYRAYRAHVRANVDFETWRDPEVDAEVRAEKARRARAYLVLAWSEVRAIDRPPLIVMRGPSGSGKSVLARTLCPCFKAELIQSDVVRKRLLGLDPLDRPSAEESAHIYSGEMSARTYRELLAQAEEALDRGRAVLLDATYLRRIDREQVRALAHRRSVPFAIVDLVCPPLEIERRLIARAARGDDASDATVEVYRAQMRAAEAPDAGEQPFLVTHTAGEGASETALRLASVLERQLADPQA